MDRQAHQTHLLGVSQRMSAIANSISKTGYLKGWKSDSIVMTAAALCQPRNVVELERLQKIVCGSLTMEGYSKQDATLVANWLHNELIAFFG